MQSVKLQVLILGNTCTTSIAQRIQGMFLSMESVSFVVILSCHFFSLCFGIVTEYSLVRNLSNNTCSADVVEFQQTEETRISCVSVCSAKSNCTAVVHQDLTNTCFGLNNLHDRENCNVDIPGGVYYTQIDMNGVHSFTFQGSVYIYNDDYQFPFDEAEKECNKFGAHLASLTTEPEFNYVLNKLPVVENRMYWLGGRKVNDAVWKWFDGAVIEEWAWFKELLHVEPCIGFSKTRHGVFACYCDWLGIAVCEKNG